MSPPSPLALLAVARVADPNRWRDRFRDAAVWHDRSALVRLGHEANVGKPSPQVLMALATLLANHGADAVPLLTAAQRRYPSDFSLNFSLVRALFHPRLVGCHQA